MSGIPLGAVAQLEDGETALEDTQRLLPLPNQASTPEPAERITAILRQGVGVVLEEMVVLHQTALLAAPAETG
jgi:hypothetical protein